MAANGLSRENQRLICPWAIRYGTGQAEAKRTPPRFFCLTINQFKYGHNCFRSSFPIEDARSFSADSFTAARTVRGVKPANQ